MSDEKNNNNLKKSKFFDREITNINLSHGIMVAKYIIFLELIIGLANLYYNLSLIDTVFIKVYIVMYVIMIIVNVYIYIFFNKLFWKSNILLTKIMIALYATFLMCWGSVISLMEQKLYGHLTSFMLNVLVCSLFFYLKKRYAIISYISSILVLFLGLLFVQSRPNVVICNYMIGMVFSLFMWIISRKLYNNLCNDLWYKKVLIENNKKLYIESETNKKNHKKLEVLNKKLHELILLDELTNIPNRRALNQFIEKVFTIGIENEILVSVIMIDIDYFKQYNDHYGHIEGDYVLKKVAKKLNDLIRDKNDFICRYGGEEFTYLALRTDEKEIYNIANKIREEIINLDIPHETNGEEEVITVSVGTATMMCNNSSAIYKCLDYADQALYQAKAYGRNQVIQYDLKSSSERSYRKGDYNVQLLYADKDILG